MSVVPTAGSPAAQGTVKCAPPPAALAFAVEGHSGNEWVLPVGADGATVRIAVTQRPATVVKKLWFEIAPASSPYPGSEVRRTPPVGRTWSPGRHVASVTWDGRKDDGQMASPGRYHLFANAQVAATTHNACNASGGRSEAYGLGYFQIGG